MLRKMHDMLLKILAGLFAMVIVTDIYLALANAASAPSASRHGELYATASGMALMTYHSGSDGFGTTVTGIVENQSESMVDSAQIVFAIENSEGAVVGSARGYLTCPLAPGQRWSFDAYCPHAAPGGKCEPLSISRY